MHSSISALIASGLLLVACATATAQAPSLTNAGTLTCTTNAVPEEQARDIALSCNFRARSGRNADYVGHATRAGAADFPPGKRVIVWTVMASSAEVHSLEGTYRGATGSEPTSALAGGKDGSILLQPVTSTSQIGDQPAPTVLSLKRVAAKA